MSQLKMFLTYEILVLGEPKFCQDLPDLFSHHEEKVDHMLWLALKFLPQLWVLSGNAHGASVQVALAHHGATENKRLC